MYFANLFNNNNLLQNFGGYVKQHNNINSEEFLFHATILVMSIYKIQALNTLCLEQMQTTKKQLTAKDDMIIVWSPTMVELLTLIPPTLSSLVIMQNKIFPLLQNVLHLKQSLSSSLRDIVNNIHKYNLPKSVMQKTLLYWQNGGLAVREYRDIAEHHYYLLARTYYQFIPVEKVVIYLPDDPSQKNHAKYTFDKKIDCITYLEQSLMPYRILCNAESQKSLEARTGVALTHSRFTPLHKIRYGVQSFLELCKYVDAVLSDFGFAREAIPQPIITTQVNLEEGVRKTLGVMFNDTDGNVGIEFGQTEERKLFFKQFNHLEHPRST